ncbi:histidine kinase N-terminal 7TM domain-containing protein [Desulfatitalea tepidiphila]|uniref:histidine kinase N-terminal 7TM domain-containing protein n=1 Tax=Desulfatitalea tepidiphila TaxID=1185843 RepID=UPI0006B486EA|nr:histidine kinase N-terminal 7TM domain-containing protein [Desulfatitalea tepidiphila]
MRPELIYSAPFFIAAFLIIIVAVFAWRRRRIRGARYLSLVCMAGAVWSIFEGLLYLGLSLETDMWVTYVQYLGTAPMIPLALCFTFAIFGFERWIHRTTKTIFILIPLAMLALAWTDPLHHLVYKNYYLIHDHAVPIRGFERGILWWGIIGTQYILAFGLTTFLIYVAWISSGVMRAQAGVILAAVSIVWLTSAVYVTGNSPISHMDISPLAFILVALSMAWGFFRYHLLDVLPIAKADIYSGIGDPILVVDDQNHLLDLNPAAEALFHIRTSAKDAAFPMPIQRPVALPLSLAQPEETVCLVNNGTKRFYETRTTPLPDKRGNRIGRMIILRDVTERHRAQWALGQSERLQGVLEMAGAVCHDLNQPIMAIMGYAELILLDLAQDDPLYPIMMNLTAQLEKITTITQKLMRITRYATKDYGGQQIIDIEKAATASD